MCWSVTERINVHVLQNHGSAIDSKFTARSRHFVFPFPQNIEGRCFSQSFARVRNLYIYSVTLSFVSNANKYLLLIDTADVHTNFEILVLAFKKIVALIFS